MSRVRETVCLSISALKRGLGDNLEYTRIEYTNDGDREYFDLYNDEDKLCCLDGEEVFIIKDDGTDLTFINQNGTKDVKFTLTLSEFKIAAFD